MVRSGQVSHDEGASSDHGVLQPPPELCVQPVTVTDPDDKVRPPGGYYPMPEYHDGKSRMYNALTYPESHTISV